MPDTASTWARDPRPPHADTCLKGVHAPYAEWNAYTSQVTSWELDRHLSTL